MGGLADGARSELSIIKGLFLILYCFNFASLRALACNNSRTAASPHLKRSRRL